MKQQFLVAILFCFMGIFSLPLRAGGLDASQQEALKKTLEILNSLSQRAEITAKDPAAKQADDYARSLTGTPENTERFYQLAGKLMESLVMQAQGDPEKIMGLLEKAQKDPAAFAAGFSDEQKKLLREVAAASEKNGATKKTP